MRLKFLIPAAAAALTAGCASDIAPYSSEFQQVVESANAKVFPCVVYIHAVAADTGSGTDSANIIGGSGVIISPDGEVLTNFHVADKASNIRCQLNTAQAYDAEIVGVDKDVDLALLKLKLPGNTPPLPCAEFETDPVQEGEFVMAMGAPWGMNRSVSIGIISCANRFLPGDSEYSLWYQTDASISPGNSGGPLVNTKGKVVGINTLGTMRGGDIAFSVPAQTILDVLPRLREYKKANWAWLGLELQELHNFEQNIYFEFDRGVVVAGTEVGSPAREAGFLPKDLITAIDGTPVTVMTAEDMPPLRRKLGLLPFGVPVNFTVERGGKALQIAVTPIAKGKVEGQELVLKRWGVTVKAINRFDNPDLYHYSQQGVYVFGLDYSGNARSCDLNTGDIILSINSRKVASIEDVQKVYDDALANVNQRSKAVITLMRNGSRRQTVLNFSKDTEKEL